MSDAKDDNHLTGRTRTPRRAKRPVVKRVIRLDLQSRLRSEDDRTSARRAPRKLNLEPTTEPAHRPATVEEPEREPRVRREGRWFVFPADGCTSQAAWREAKRENGWP